METYLTHHGILGMKWGVRRYQNEDGTLTADGKARLASRSAKFVRKSEKHKSTSKKRFVSTAVSGVSYGVLKSLVETTVKGAAADIIINEGIKAAADVAGIITGFAAVSTLSHVAISAGQMAYSTYLSKKIFDEKKDNN